MDEIVLIGIAIVLFIASLCFLIWALKLKGHLDLIYAIDSQIENLFCTVDLETRRIQFASSAVLQIIGLNLEDVDSHEVREFVHPDDVKLIGSALKSIDEKKKKGYSKQNTMDHLRIRLRDVQYGWQWYELSAFIMHSHSRKFLCCSFNPINDQIRLTDELMESKRVIDVLLHNSFDIVWKLDCLSRRLTLLTSVTKKKWGVDDRESGFMPINEDFFAPELIESFRVMLNKRIADLADSDKEMDEPQNFLVPVRNRDGSVTEFITRSTLEKNEIGQFTLYGISQLVQRKNELS